MENNIEEVKKEITHSAKKHNMSKENLRKLFDAMIEGIELGLKDNKKSK